MTKLLKINEKQYYFKIVSHIIHYFKFLRVIDVLISIKFDQPLTPYIPYIYGYSKALCKELWL